MSYTKANLSLGEELFAAMANLYGQTPMKKDPDLRWHEFDDLGDRNWSLHVGYSVDWDGDDCEVSIHRAVLNTGQQEVELVLTGIDTNKWGAELAEIEYLGAQMAAEELSRHQGDDR